MFGGILPSPDVAAGAFDGVVGVVATVGGDLRGTFSGS